MSNTPTVNDAAHAELMVFHIEPGGAIVYANDVACRVLEYPADAITRLRACDVDTDPGVLPGAIAQRFALLRERKALVRITEFRTASGRLVPVEVSTNHFEFGGLERVLAVALDITERRQSERLMRLMHVSIEQSASALFWVTEEARFFYANRCAWESLGYTQAELLRLRVHDIAPGVDADRWPDLWARMKRVGAMTYETSHRRKDGMTFPVELSLNYVDYRGDEYLFGRARDISARLRTAAELRESEERLQQAQKMEAIGRFAGGVAHDFNNLLTAILGYTELLIGDARDDDPQRPYLVEVRSAAERAAHLTRQLLAFSRKQVVQPRLLDLNAVIIGFERMLRRLIPENVQLTIRPGDDLGLALADRVQLEQVVMNLAVNARDAMPDGGALQIETARVSVAGAGAEDPPGALAPGDYIRLTVTDTGTGMTEDVAAHVFEPFFSTKTGEKGTGLGLATVYGIVRQSGGHISVRTQAAGGSAFDIYLPRMSAPADAEPRPPEAAIAITAAARPAEVLVVEDDPLVRRFVCEVLLKCGYRVLEASAAEEAMALANGHRPPIDLVVTDLVMPGMNGRDLAIRIRAEHPQMAVLFMSGYADQIVVTEELLGPRTGFLQKPFTPDRISSEVRRLISDADRR